ncbi:MAG: polymorphic toxin type 46 domain-containing protein [Polyangiaceae bacterium]
MSIRTVKSLSFDDYRSELGIKAWVAAARVTDAPRTRRGISEALKFFQANMRALSPARALEFLRCMDLSKPVAIVTLLPGERIIGYRGPAESQFKLFFSRSGRSVQSLGVNPTDRRFVSFNVRAPAPALESTASPAKDTWSLPREYMANGGATQLLLPNSFATLLVEHDSA